MSNPFTPNFGQAPNTLVGRDFQIEEIARALDNAPGDPALTSIFMGARGTGKTVLLTKMATIASSQGWIAVNVACMPGVLEDIYQGTLRAGREFLDAGPEKRLTGVNVGQVLGVSWTETTQPEQTWFLRMAHLLDQLQEVNVGLLITVDEVQPTLDEMIRLASYYQLFIREERKISLLMAGLPSHIFALLGDKTVSFMRRASQYRLGKIPANDIRFALQQTAEQGQKIFTEEALEKAAVACEGLPFMLQLVGYRSWQAAGTKIEIGLSEVDAGIERARIDLEDRVLRSSLNELSAQDIAYLSAMLEDDGPSATSDIAKRMKKSDAYASQYRRRLIDRGIIGPRGRGKVDFDLPFLREFLPEYLD